MKKYIFIATIVIAPFMMSGCIGTEKEAYSRYLDYQTKTHLIFPLKGESYIGWGGRTLKQNAHASLKDQRFALDIVALKEGHAVLSAKEVEKDTFKTYSGDENLNESYYIFNREVLATGAGTVVATKNNIADNIPGPGKYKPNRKEPAGNYVVLDHGNGEFSMFAHLKYQSVYVRKGDSVEQGDVLGLCGNSGNSTEPHLHYHVQNTKEIQKGEGLPAQFNDYIANGTFVKRGEPIRGQIVQPQ